METQTFSDVYVQTRKISADKTIGVIVTHTPYSCVVNQYDFIGNNAVLNSRREFSNEGNGQVYERVKEFIKSIIGADAILHFFDPDNRDIPISGALEHALKNHIDLSD